MQTTSGSPRWVTVMPVLPCRSLTVFLCIQVWRRARMLSQYAIEKVVSSPFLRCLQTAAMVCTSLGIRTVEVDNSLSEVCDLSAVSAGTMGSVLPSL